MAGNDLEKSGAEGLATGMFGTFAEEPAQEPAKANEEKLVPVAPPVAVPEVNTSNGGFTQLLRALNYDAVKAIPAAAPVAVPVEHSMESPGPGGPMTELLRTISGSGAEASTVEKPVLPPGASQVTSFLPGSAPGVSAVPVTLVSASPASPAAGSFTQLFERMEGEPSKVVKPETPAPSFTQLFATPVVPAPSLEPTQPVPAHGLASAAPTSPPGSFTQMFQTLSAPATEPVRQGTSQMAPAAEAARPGVSEASTAPVAPPAAIPAQSHANTPSSFTQLFQSLDPARDAPPTVEAPMQASAARPGSFTQMFQTLGEEPKAQEPVAGPGSFPSMVEAPGRSSAPARPVAQASPSSFEQTSAASAPEPRGSGASQIFATYREPPAVRVEQGPTFTPIERAAGGTSAPSMPSGGGLTQLLRALDAPTPSAKPYATPSYAPPTAPAARPGSFTEVYGELGEPPATAAPAAPLAAPQPLVGTGPSEFTRLIHASALREAGLRGGGTPAGTAGTLPAAPAAGGSGFAMPSGLPIVPHASLATSAAPSASISGPAGLHASASAAGGGHASFATPHLPGVAAASAVKIPEMAKAGSAPAGMQKYLPLLLILVIFLLLAILVAVVVLMKK